MGLRKIIPRASDFVSKLFAEFIGTFVFLTTISAAAGAAGDNTPIYIGFTLMILVFSFGFVSGGQFNPAVSLGLCLAEAQTAKDTLAVVGVQLVGGILGALAGTGLTGRMDDPAVPKPGDNYSIVQALFAEVVYTYMLVVVVLHVAASKQAGNHFFGLCIGGVVVVGAGSMGGISGGAFNPAVAVGLHVTRLIFGHTDAIQYIWIYIVSGTLGGLLAAVTYLIMNDATPEGEEGKQKSEARARDATPAPSAYTQRETAQQRKLDEMYATHANNDRLYAQMHLLNNEVNFAYHADNEPPPIQNMDPRTRFI